VRDRAPEDPGHLHLGNPDVIRDLRLRHVVDEPERQHLALPGRQLPSGDTDRDALVG